MLIDTCSNVDCSRESSTATVFVGFSGNYVVVLAQGSSCSPFPGSEICEQQFFPIAKAMAPVVALKIIQALSNPGVALRGIPFLADVEARIVVDARPLSGRIIIMVGDTAEVSPQPLHSFVGVVSGPRSRRAEFQSFTQKKFSSRRDSGIFAKVVKSCIGRTSQMINGTHLTVVIFNIEPSGQIRVGSKSMGFFHA